MLVRPSLVLSQVANAKKILRVTTVATVFGPSVGVLEGRGCSCLVGCVSAGVRLSVGRLVAICGLFAPRAILHLRT